MSDGPVAVVVVDDFLVVVVVVVVVVALVIDLIVIDGVPRRLHSKMLFLNIADFPSPNDNGDSDLWRPLLG